MKEKDKTVKTSRSDFLRYRKGKMSEREKNVFERELQKDPFAAEAMEGFSELPPEISETDLSQLDSKLKFRTVRKNRFVIYRIAASAAVLMIISSIFIIVRKNYDSIKEENTAVTVQVPMDIEKAKPIEGKILKDEKKNIPGAKPVIPEAARRSAVEMNPESEPKVVVAENKVADAVTRDVKEDLQVAEELKAEPVAAEQAFPAAPVNVIAYGARKKAAAETEVYNLDEVVVIGYGEPAEEQPGFTPALPADGKKSFNEYIEGNIKVPETLNAGEKVVVVMSFTVKTTGEIDSIKVVRSPGEEFSSEAKRLILEGPAWKPAKSDGALQDDVVRLRIVFTK